MKKMVSITSQGQITIPKSIRDALDITGQTKALVAKKDGLIVIKPALNFADLAGSIKTKIRLTDQELKAARESFSQNWPRIRQEDE